MATFKSFVVQWSAKVTGHWLQLKPLHMLLCLMNRLTLPGLGGGLVGPRLTFIVYIPRTKNVETLRLNDFS